MKQLKNWTARRAGGRITINGVDAQTGNPIKVVGVDTIEAGSPFPIATHKDGEKFELGSVAVPMQGR